METIGFFAVGALSMTIQIIAIVSMIALVVSIWMALFACLWWIGHSIHWKIIKWWKYDRKGIK